MPYNSGSGAYERRTTTVIDATPDGDTVAVAIDVKLDTAADDAVLDLNHHKTNGNHYPAASTHTDSRFLKQSPAGVVDWADGVPAPDAALKTMANVTSAALESVMMGNISTHAHDATGAYNHIINGNFDIWQRATSQTTNGYGSADRWVNSNSGSTKTTSRQAFAVGSAFPDGEKCPSYYSRTVATSAAGAGNLVRQQQRIEFVKTLAGKKATLSFYAKADAARNIAVELVQNFGTTGGSTEIPAIGAQKIALTTAWQRFTVVFDVPSISSKTLGSDANDYLAVTFWFDAGSNFNPRTDSLGQQSGTFEISNVAIIEGDVDIKPTPRSIGEELALCQRYYEVASLYTWADPTASSSIAVINWSFKVLKRANPALNQVLNANPSGLVYNSTAQYSINGCAFAYNTVAVAGGVIVKATADSEL